MEDIQNQAASFRKKRRISKYSVGASRKKTITDPEPYSILITSMPNGRSYTVHICPADQTHLLKREAHFSEGDLRDTLAHCSLADAVRIIAQAQLTGKCDLRRRKIYLDVARAASLGWYGAHRV